MIKIRSKSVKKNKKQKQPRNVVVMQQPTKRTSLPTRRASSKTKPVKAMRQTTGKSNKPAKATKTINWRKIGRGVAISVIIVLLGGIVYGLFGSAYFRVTTISIDGTQFLDENIMRQQVETALNGPIWQFWAGNWWLASTKRYCQPLQEYNLISCRLKRQWPNKLTLKIQEEPVVTIWQENGWYYWVDRFGRVVKQEAPNPASAKLYPVVDSRDRLVTDRQVAVDTKLWSLITASQTNWLGSAPQQFIFKQQEPNSLQAVLDNQQIIKLTLRDSLDNQLKLWQAGQSKFAQQLSQAKIIDLRYGDRIIFQ